LKYDWHSNEKKWHSGYEETKWHFYSNDMNELTYMKDNYMKMIMNDKYEIKKWQSEWINHDKWHYKTNDKGHDFLTWHQKMRNGHNNKIGSIENLKEHRNDMKEKWQIWLLKWMTMT